MNKPVIAFDCDDVIVSTGTPLVEQYNNLHDTHVRHEDFYSKDYEHIWKASPETVAHDLFTYLLTDAYSNLTPMPGAADVLHKLAETYTLYIVTGRPDFTEQATEKWVNRHVPNIFERIVFTNFFKTPNSKGSLRTKADVCKELGAQWLVDDHLHHIKNVAEQDITGLLFGNLPWEQTAELIPKLIKIRDWQELDDYFSQQS